MTLETIQPAVVVAALLSVIMEWAPGAREWWLTLASAKKAQLMAAAVFLVTLGLALFRCYAYDGVCPNWQTFVGDLFVTFLLALAANQSVHAIDKALTRSA